MASTKKSTTKKEPSRHLAALARLEQALGLDEIERREFARHLLDGFSDYEEDRWIEPGGRLRFREVPEEWFQSPNTLGHVTLRVLREGTPSLATRVARFFLAICDPGPNENVGPPGVGLAWLHLSRLGMEPPIEPARLAELAFCMPEDFFNGVTEEEVLPVSRLILENGKPLDAWELHALLAAVSWARIHTREPFRLFDDLMRADWLPSAVKRELCRGLLDSHPEAQRLRERGAAIYAAWHDQTERLDIPRAYWEILRGGVGNLHPGLRRHAVTALVENLGEPLSAVIAEFYLKRFSNDQSTNAVSEGVLDLIRLHAGDLEPEVVKQWLRKSLKRGSAFVRKAAYRAGADLFGPAFAHPALKDPSRMVRDWAASFLSPEKLKRRSKSRSEPEGHPGASPKP